MDKITGFFLDPENNIAEPRTIDRSLSAYYSLLRCTCIDMPVRYIGERRFLIICDDEGLLVEQPVISAIDSDLNPALVGPLFVVQYDGPDEVSLTDRDIMYVMAHIQSLPVRCAGGIKLYPMLTCIRYS